MGIFSMEDPLTPQYIESQGFRTQHKPNDPTILYEVHLLSDKWMTLERATLRFYYKAAKPSKARVCELKYKQTRGKKTYNMTKHLIYPENESDLCLVISEAVKILEKDWRCPFNTISVYKPRY